jgi:chromosome segregation ATPase
MGFFPPTEGRGHTWIARMRGLGREEEDLEDTVSHLSIYLTSLDALYREQAAQLKQLIHGIEKVTQELEEQRTRAASAEYSLAALQAQMQEYENRLGIGGWIEEEEEEEEEEPEETHWDKGTQTEDEVMNQCLPIKKRPIRIEEDSP